jgi:hypothetical protein
MASYRVAELEAEKDQLEAIQIDLRTELTVLSAQVCLTKWIYANGTALAALLLIAAITATLSFVLTEYSLSLRRQRRRRGRRL